MPIYIRSIKQKTMTKYNLLIITLWVQGFVTIIAASSYDLYANQLVGSETRLPSEIRTNQQPANSITYQPSNSEIIANFDTGSAAAGVDSNHDGEKFDAHMFIGEEMDDRIRNTAKRIRMAEAVNYLTTFGYEFGDLRGLQGQRLEMYIAPALKKFQRKMGIPETGVLDDATKHEMAKPRCAFPDFIAPESTRSKRFVLGKTQWDETDFPLTIRFESHSNQMGRLAQEDAFMEAANEWAKVSGLEFGKATGRNAKISIGFTRHDGPWGVLGKAWFPKVGRIEFENGENWIPKIPANGGSAGLSFFSVAMHELGHALGISHSNVRNAIMHGQYQRNVLELTRDDILAATRLYGRPTTTTTRAPTTKASNKNKNNKNSNRRGKQSNLRSQKVGNRNNKNNNTQRQLTSNKKNSNSQRNGNNIVRRNNNKNNRRNNIRNNNNKRNNGNLNNNNRRNNGGSGGKRNNRNSRR